jgi:hypothetical protein
MRLLLSLCVCVCVFFRSEYRPAFYVNILMYYSDNTWAWGSVMVKALRYESEGPGIDSRCRQVFFSVASDSSMCPGVDSACKNECTALDTHTTA